MKTLRSLPCSARPADAAPAGPAARRPARPWQALLTGLALSVSLGAQSYAAPASLEGRWAMAPAGSSFAEEVTGPAPDAVSLIITRDDRERLSYRLVESRGGEVVAQGAYDLAFPAGAGSASTADGEPLPVAASRDARGTVLIRAPEVAGARALIRLSRVGAGRLLLEHEVAAPSGLVRLETISLLRTPEVGAR